MTKEIDEEVAASSLPSAAMDALSVHVPVLTNATSPLVALIVHTLEVSEVKVFAPAPVDGVAVSVGGTLVLTYEDTNEEESMVSVRDVGAGVGSASTSKDIEVAVAVAYVPFAAIVAPRIHVPVLINDTNPLEAFIVHTPPVEEVNAFEPPPAEAVAVIVGGVSLSS